MLFFGSSRKDAGSARSLSGSLMRGIGDEGASVDAPMQGEEAFDSASGGSAFLHCLEEVDRRWPNLKYLSLSLYSAWILLTMTNNGATTVLVGIDPGLLSVRLYLSSGMALALCLIGSAIFQKKAKTLVGNPVWVLSMGLLASVATCLLSMGLLPADPVASQPLFYACGIATGVGTAFVCLRIGWLYSVPPEGEVPFFVIGKAMLIADLLFFLIMGLPDGISGAMLGLLPVLAAATALLGRGTPGSRRDETDLVPAESLPKAFFTKLLASIAVFSFVVGVVKGCSALMQSAEDVSDQSIVVVFISFVIVGLVMLVACAALSIRNFEISKLYFPLMVCSCAAILLCAPFGNSLGAMQNIIINVGYNLFIVAVWALLSDLAERTTIMPIRVFGLGRGASGLGTTIGWLISYGMVTAGLPAASFLAPFFLVATVVVFAMVLLMLGQQTVSEALEKMYERASSSSTDSRNDAAPDGPSTWDGFCEKLSRDHGLTAREEEVLRLLSRGRTNGYIALELNISQNTVKGHTRNVFAKLGVHSRQELIDIFTHHMAS